MTPEPWMTPAPGFMRGATMAEYGRGAVGSGGGGGGRALEGEERSWASGGERRGEPRLAGR